MYFFVFSNSKAPIHISEHDRRAFVIHIKKNKEEVQQMLHKENYKKDIIDTIKDPSAFKWHLLNEVTYDRDMFFTDAPLTADKEVLIETNKDDFVSMMEEAFENKEFPFDNYREDRTIGMNSENIVDYSYSGYIHKIDCFRAMKKSELFKNVYFTANDLENFCKENCTKWPNGELTRQAKCKETGKKKRLYLMHITETDGVYNADLTETALWDDYKGKDLY